MLQKGFPAIISGKNKWIQTKQDKMKRRQKGNSQENSNMFYMQEE